MMRRMRTAFSLLTIFPVLGASEEPTDLDLRRSVAFFPLVGLFLGLVVVLPGLFMVRAGLPALVAALCVVAAEAYLTRGLHLDGVADVLDGFGGATPEKRLAIMKDSSIGVFGTLGLLFTLLFKIAGVALLIDDDRGVLPLLAGPAAARLAMILLACEADYPRERGTGHFMVGKVGKKEAGIGVLPVLPLMMCGLPSIVTVAGAMVPALWLRKKAAGAFGGVTGDVLGAACEWGEAVGWFAAGVSLSLIL